MASQDPLVAVFDYEAAKKRQEERTSLNQQVEPDFKPWKVFVNQIDTYHGKKLVDHLADLVYTNPENFIENAELEREYDEEDEDGEEVTLAPAPSKIIEPPKKYEVIGTVVDRSYPRPDNVTAIVSDSPDKDAFLSTLMKCGTVIYDITRDPGQVEEARWLLEAIARELESVAEKTPSAFKRDEEVRYFVLISTVMTWALSKPLDPENPDLPFTEADYRKRKPHPNFKKHMQLEKDVVLIKKRAGLAKKLKTLVVCCGITYGDGEGPLHHLFKMAWQNSPSLPVFGKGDNNIPLLHVRDMCAVLSTVLQSWPPLHYIVAVEQGRCSQYAIVKSISKQLATGTVKRIAKEEAFLLPEITQQVYDVMTMNLNVDPEYIVDRIDWHFYVPFRDNTRAIVEEYRAARNLRPLKVIVLGPPASGKTRIARYLANHYGIHYVYVKTLITDAIQDLSARIEAATLASEDNEQADTDEVDEPEDDKEEAATVEDLRRQLDEIRDDMAENSGRLGDVALNKLFLKRLQARDCLNQGYVLDGYPKTLEQAEGLFGSFGENVDEIEDTIDEQTDIGTATSNDQSIMPDLVVVLEASDEYLIERVISLPEREIQHTHYTEEHMIRRLREYRERNTDDNTPLQFFDEMEIHLLICPIESDTCPDMFSTIYQCLDKLGKPRNYGPTPQQIKDAEKRAAAELQETEAAKRRQVEKEFSERKKQRERKMMEWTNLMEKLKEEEEERLCILGEPLRHYLAKYVFPTLTQGLLEVAKLRPDDPVDFLAEYLFKENPEGKMFEPDYTERMSMLFDAIEQLQQDILPQDESRNEAAECLKTAKERIVPEVTEGTDVYHEDEACRNARAPPISRGTVLYEDEEVGEKEEEGDACYNGTSLDSVNNRR